MLEKDGTKAGLLFDNTTSSDHRFRVRIPNRTIKTIITHTAKP